MQSLDARCSLVIHFPVMFGTILILIVTVMHVYVFWRAASVPFVKQRIPTRVIVISGMILWLVFYLGRVYGRGGSGVAAAVQLVGMNWMAVLFLTATALLTVDIVTGFGLLMQRSAPALRGLALLAGGLLSAIALVQGLRPPEVHDYEVRIAGLPREMEGKVLVALSDLHVGPHPGKSWLEARAAQMRGLEPDLVVLLGDLFEGRGASHAELVPALQGLSAPLGVWAVPGNHDFRRSGDDGLATLDAAGVQVLINRWVEISPGLVLAGVEDLTVHRRRGHGGDPLAHALAGRPPGAVILLSHTPLEYERAAEEGVDLMLSGHTHGGQIWPFGYLVRLAYPLLEGRYQVGDMTAIVCRGTGTWGPRMRLWRTGEILCITLRSVQAESAPCYRESRTTRKGGLSAGS